MMLASSMNNRFKFRVWDFFHKQWITGAAIELNGRIINTSFAEPETNCVALQYTGLTDKNGNLIFEGDIVQYNQNSSYDNMDFIVKWRDDKLGFIFQSNSGEQLVNQTPHLNRFKHLEVVGNIFEHENLLK